MANWCSLFCATDQPPRLADAIRAWLTAHAYLPYDAYDILPGASYPHAVKLFVAPAQQGGTGVWWTRVILAAPASGLAEALTLVGACHEFILNPTTGNTSSTAGVAGIASPIAGIASPIAGVDPALLPADVRGLAGGIDLKQAGKMADKMLGSLGGKLNMSAADAAGARALLSNSGANWSSSSGATLSARAHDLGLPDDWRAPDFAVLSDAYAIHTRLRRSPTARLYPGDADARDAVPHALAYLPIFAGKKEQS